MGRLTAIVTSGPGTWIRLIQAYIWLFRAKRLMKRASGNQWLFAQGKSADSPETQRTLSEADWAGIKRRVAAISRASRYPVSWAFCLQKSLALREWLAKEEIFVEVRYGVRKNGEGYDAHAWVVHGGKILNDSVRHVSTFAPLKTFDYYEKDFSSELQGAIVASRTSGDSAG